MPLQMPVEIFKEPDAAALCLSRLRVHPVITFQRGCMVQSAEINNIPSSHFFVCLYYLEHSFLRCMYRGSIGEYIAYVHIYIQIYIYTHTHTHHAPNPLCCYLLDYLTDVFQSIIDYTCIIDYYTSALKSPKKLQDDISIFISLLLHGRHCFFLFNPFIPIILFLALVLAWEEGDQQTSSCLWLGWQQELGMLCLSCRFILPFFVYILYIVIFFISQQGRVI